MTMPLHKRLIMPATLEALAALHSSVNTTGTTPDDDLDVLAALLLSAQAKRILQLGTFLGGSALVLADIARQNGGDAALVVTVDPNPAMNESCRKYAALAGLGGVIKTVDGLSTEPALLKQWAAQSWDAIYLDTTHQFGQTFEEIRALTQLCGPHTLLLFHDASTHAANTLDTGKQGGVKGAMTEYCLLNPRWQMFIFEKPAFGQFGIGVMQRKA